MSAEMYEFWMICAHWRLTGLEVGAMSVIEKYGALAAFAIGVGTTEKTRMNANSPKSMPFAVSSNCDSRKFSVQIDVAFRITRLPA
jgi:homoaconitase/3-isopropylmalate dehydratase large subunit